MSERSTFYERLGVAPTATLDQIKAAYRGLASKYHPDINQGTDADARMAAINEAFTTLRDPARRAAYDRFLLRVTRRTIVAGTAAPKDRSAETVARWKRAREDYERRRATRKLTAQAGRAPASEQTVLTRIGFAVAGSVMVAVSVIMLLSGPESNETWATPAAAMHRAKLAVHHARRGDAMGALVAIRDGSDITADFGSEACRERTFVRFADKIAIVTSDGSLYRPHDRDAVLSQTESWRTGDRVIVCRSGHEVSIANATSYAWLAATFERTAASEQVLCGPSVIRSVGRDGAGVELVDGTSYAIDPRSVAHYATSDWQTGNHVVLCRSGSSASIENLTTAAKVQASYDGAAPRSAANCATKTVTRGRDLAAAHHEVHRPAHAEHVVVCVTKDETGARLLPPSAEKVVADRY